jgi:hydrogenase maturation factor HypE
VTFYTARPRIVRAKQWFAHGDHAAVLEGIRSASGTLDIAQAQAFSRRHVEPGDWIVSDGAGKLHVLTPAEFSQQFEDA